MFFSGSPPRARLLLLLSGAFSWLVMGSSLGAASTSTPRHAPAQQRLLTLSELRQVKGAQMSSTSPGGVQTLNPTEEPNAGGTFPWEGSVGDLNTLNGNKLTAVPLVSWTARGGLPLALVLYHNSAASAQSELGYHWTHSFAIYGMVDPVTRDFTVQWGDNLEYTFVRNPEGIFSAPEGIFDTLTLDTATQTYTLTRKDQVRYTFSQPNGVRWNCTRIADRNSNAITIQHTAGDFVSQVVDPTGRALTFHYSGATLTEVSDPMGRTFEFAQTGGNLTQIAFPAVEGQVPTLGLAYNSANNITQLTDLRGKHWTFGYTPNGRALAWERNPLLQETHYYYATGQTRVVDPRGNETTHFYQNGQLVRTEDPTHAAQQYAYTGAMRTSSTDPEGNLTQYTYDSRGNLLTITDALGKVSAAQYNAKNDPVRLTRPSGKQVVLDYDSAGNLVGRTDPLQQSTHFTVNAFGLMTSAVDPLGRTTLFGCDAHGNRASVTDPLGRARSAVYDTLGRILSQSVGGQTTTLRYNTQGQVSQIVAPGNRVTLFSYDLAGNPLTRTNALGELAQLVYDDAGRLIRQTDALGRSTEQGYDTAGNRVRVTDGRGKTTTYAYDTRNLLTNISYPEGTSQSYSYGARGLLSARSDGRGIQAGYSYDALGAVVGIHYSEGTPDVSFVLDSEGQKVSMTDGTGITGYRYDAAGRLLERTTPEGQVQFGYDAAGQLLQRSGGGTATAYAYDAAGQLVGVVEGGTQSTVYDYDTLGRLSTTALPNGVFETRTYSDAGDLIRLESTKAGTTLTRQDYTFDALGRKTGESTPESTLSYHYDAAGQLLSELRIGLNPYFLQYSYDNAGNRLTRTANGVLESYAYDDANKLLTAGGKLYSYDAAGNVTSVTSSLGSTSLTWDAESRLRSVTQGSATVSYHYNGLGQRIGKSGSRSARYVLTDDTIDTAVLSDGSARYTHGVMGLVSENRSGQSRYFHADALGSIRAQTNAAGAITDLQSTDAFGLPITSAGNSPTPFGFAGSQGYQQDSETGLMRLGHRMYDATTGRFLSRDPLQAGSNWYIYCDNDPLNAIDPEGLDRIVIGWEGSHKDKGADRPIYDGRMDGYGDDGNLIWTMPIDSGGHGKGMLPPGNYIISEPPYRSRCPEATGGFFTPIDPRFRTPRNKLGVHYDGNLPGTEGCIGIKNWEDYLRWLDYLRKLRVDKKNPLPIVVKPLPKQLPPDLRKK